MTTSYDIDVLSTGLDNLLGDIQFDNMTTDDFIDFVNEVESYTQRLVELALQAADLVEVLESEKDFLEMELHNAQCWQEELEDRANGD